MGQIKDERNKVTLRSLVENIFLGWALETSRTAILIVGVWKVVLRVGVAEKVRKNPQYPAGRWGSLSWRLIGYILGVCLTCDRWIQVMTPGNLDDFSKFTKS